MTAQPKTIYFLPYIRVGAVVFIVASTLFGEQYQPSKLAIRFISMINVCLAVFLLIDFSILVLQLRTKGKKQNLQKWMATVFVLTVITAWLVPLTLAYAQSVVVNIR